MFIQSLRLLDVFRAVLTNWSGYCNASKVQWLASSIRLERCCAKVETGFGLPLISALSSAAYTKLVRQVYRAGPDPLMLQR